MVALGTKPKLKTTITSSNYHSAMMATLSYNALICPPDDTFCSAAKMMDANFRKEVSRQSNSWFEYIISHTYIGTVLQWAVTIWGTWCLIKGMTVFFVRMRALCCSRKGCCALLLTVCQFLDSSLNPLHLLRTQMKQRITKLEYKYAMIQKDMEEMMAPHIDLLAKLVEIESSCLHDSELGAPRTPSPHPVSWGSPIQDEITDYYGTSGGNSIYDEPKLPRKIESKNTINKNNRRRTSAMETFAAPHYEHVLIPAGLTAHPAHLIQMILVPYQNNMTHWTTQHIFF